MQQIPMAFSVNAAQTFDNFIIAENETAISSLRSLNGEITYLWSAESCGKSHLLKALCHDRVQYQSAAYIDLAILSEEDSQGLEQWAQPKVVIALDHLEALEKKPQQQMHVFNLINAVKAQGAVLVVASRYPVAELPVQLPDLRTRLQWGESLHLATMPDTELAKWMQSVMHQRGLSLPMAVAEFMLSRYSRSMKNLQQQLQQLEVASIEQARKLTIPFVKQVLEDS